MRYTQGTSSWRRYKLMHARWMTIKMEYKHIERAEIERGIWRALPGDLLRGQQAVTRSYALERTHSNTPTPSRTLYHPHSITPSLSMTPTLPRCAKRRIFRRRPRRRPSGPSPNQCGHPVLSRDRPSINGNQPALYSAPPRALSSDSLVIIMVRHSLRNLSIIIQ